MTRAQVMRLAALLKDAAENYDDHVFEKMRYVVHVGNNLVFEWDDVSEDDLEGIEAER